LFVVCRDRCSDLGGVGVFWWSTNSAFCSSGLQPGFICLLPACTVFGSSSCCAFVTFYSVCFIPFKPFINFLLPRWVLFGYSCPAARPMTLGVRSYLRCSQRCFDRRCLLLLSCFWFLFSISWSFVLALNFSLPRFASIRTSLLVGRTRFRLLDGAALLSFRTLVRLWP
jgi:hypothetical protein